MDVSVVIINYRSTQLAIESINSIKKYTKEIDFELIVVDNDSQDGSENLLKKDHPDIIFMQTGYNSGFARANNVGFKIAQGKYILLLNADTLLFDNVLKKCFQKMENDTSIASIGGLQLNSDKSPMPYYKNSAIFRRTLYILPQIGLLNDLIQKLIPEPIYENPNQTDLLGGAFMFVRKEAIEIIGGLDENFFMYAEDVEWSGRLRKAGKLCYFGDIQFIHLENMTDYRRTRISWTNRFGTQMLVSNLLWIRKEKGLLAYLILIFHYLSLSISFFLWKITVNIINFRNPFFQLDSQKIFALKTKVLLKYFLKTVFNQKSFYKISPEDNIDKVYQ